MVNHLTPSKQIIQSSKTKFITKRNFQTTLWHANVINISGRYLSCLLFVFIQNMKCNTISLFFVFLVLLWLRNEGQGIRVIWNVILPSASGNLLAIKKQASIPQWCETMAKLYEDFVLDNISGILLKRETWPFPLLERYMKLK